VRALSYFHQLDGAEPVVDVSVRIEDGRVVEHWPLGERFDEGAAVRWRGVGVRDAACTDHEYPRASDPACRALGTAGCEATELRRYETADGACLTRDDETYDHLFYRGVVGPAALPVEVAVNGRQVRVQLRPPTGSAALVRVTRDAHDVQISTLTVEAGQPAAVLPSVRLRGPCPPHDPRVHGRGRSCAEVRAEPASDAMAQLRGHLRTAGLTAAEAAAFESAWYADLFRPGGDGPEDALLYWLPPEVVEALLPLTLDPPPAAVRRAMLVRVGLAP
jgi:hypothetical protein